MPYFSKLATLALVSILVVPTVILSSHALDFKGLTDFKLDISRVSKNNDGYVALASSRD
jgi:hypothetical protein